MTFASVVRFLNKPEYLYQPKAILRRSLGWKRSSANGTEIVQLPWGFPLEVNTSELIGRIISHSGIFELSAVEAIFRLTDSTDVFLDLGANIGYMSSAAHASKAKMVISFEPHPELFRQLQRNVSLWAEVRPGIANREFVRQEAISNKSGTAKLRFSKREFSKNQGVATLENGHGRDDCVEVEVSTVALDQVIEQCGEGVGVLKIDIEGHELTAFEAAMAPLQAGSVRDIIYEDHQGMSSDVSRLLSSCGYSLFGLNKTLLGPVLLDSKAAVDRFRPYSPDPLNFLATRSPDRARRRMSHHGFQCLAGQ
jgi:FkbM family methyltransferase